MADVIRGITTCTRYSVWYPDGYSAWSNPEQEVVHSPIRLSVPERLPNEALLELFACFGKEGGKDILYLGDSVVERISRYDADRRTLGEMFTDQVSDLFSTLVISRSAYNAELYRLLLMVVAEMRYHPRFVIVPINIRSFSPQWFFNPSWQFPQERMLLQQFVVEKQIKSNPTLEETPTPAAFEAFDALPVLYPDSPFDRVGQFRLLINSAPRLTNNGVFDSSSYSPFTICIHCNRITYDSPPLSRSANGPRLLGLQRFYM